MSGSKKYRIILYLHKRKGIERTKEISGFESYKKALKCVESDHPNLPYNIQTYWGGD